MNKFIALIFSFLILLGTPGCVALTSALPIIDSAISDSSIVLKGIETAFDAYQATHAVSPADRLEYDKLLASAYQDLALGNRAVTDLKQVDQGQYDAAFSDFKTAFETLVAFLKAKGITPVGSGLVGVGTQGGDDFPTPRVIGLKIRS